MIAVIFTVLRQWGDVGRLVKRLRAHPLLILVIIFDSSLLAVQLWLFGWAPQTGHGLDLALGFLLLPLVMVLAGVLLHRERLSAGRLVAIAFALTGVAAAVFLAGGIGWATGIVALGYPAYFIVRRHFRLDSTGATGLEFATMALFAVVVLFKPDAVMPVVTDGQLALLVIVLGVLGATGFLAYLQASRMLPFGVFGLLGYLEPILLVLVSVTLLGEPFEVGDAVVYGPILIAIAVLSGEGLRTRGLENGRGSSVLPADVR